MTWFDEAEKTEPAQTMSGGKAWAVMLAWVVILVLSIYAIPFGLHALGDLIVSGWEAGGWR